MDISFLTIRRSKFDFNYVIAQYIPCIFFCEPSSIIWKFVNAHNLLHQESMVSLLWITSCSRVSTMPSTVTPGGMKPELDATPP